MVADSVNVMSDPEKIYFREMTSADLQLMHEWLNNMQVLQLYKRSPCSYADIVETYSPNITGQSASRPFMIMYGNMPIGYVEMCMLGDLPDPPEGLPVEEGAATLSLLIGEPEFMSKGLGPAMVTEFLKEIVFKHEDTCTCLTGVEPENRAMLRLCEQSGFRRLKTIRVAAEGKPEYLMKITKDDILTAT